MTDPKDELGARFDDRRPDSDTSDEKSGDTHNASSVDNSNDVDNTSDMNNSSDNDNPSNTGNTGQAGSRPGPERDADATRHRRQVPMYLPEKKAERLNELYERLDGRSKVAGEGGIEKHADFMEELADFAVEHEDEFAARLDIGHDEESEH